MQIRPSQIEPGQPFDLFYFIRNHLDSSTYYVRAVVYDVRSGEVLLTENLRQSDTNPRLYSKRVQAPPDPSGNGRNIVAIATVYTDAGYSVRSDEFEEQEQYFLVRGSLSEIVVGGGGVDYGIVREILQEELGKLPKPPDPTPLPPMPFDALFGAIGKLQQEINRVPKEHPDLAPVLDRVADVQQAIADLPEPEKIDLAPIQAAVERAIADLFREQRRAGTAMSAEQLRIVRELAPKITQAIEAAAGDVVSRQEISIPLSSLITRNEPEAKEPDLSNLF